MNTIDGITILNTIVIDYQLIYCLLAALSVASMIFLLIFGFIKAIDGHVALGIFLLIGSFVAGLLVANCMAESKEYPHNAYQIVIDDSVSYNEFVEKYTVISQDGEIWTVREKNIQK